jgi:Uma2 family endonuclease
MLKVMTMQSIPENILAKGDYIFMKPDVTESEFWELTNEDSNCELIDGVLIIHSPASEEHESLFRQIISIIQLNLDASREGKVYGSRFVMRLSEKWNPEPDIIVVTPDKYSNIKSTHLEGPAAIAIEILSKSSKDIDLQKKLPKYLTAGVKETWIVDPQRKILSVHDARGTVEYGNPSAATLIKSNVLQHLTFQVNWIWDREKYSTLDIAKIIIERK